MRITTTLSLCLLNLIITNESLLAQPTSVNLISVTSDGTAGPSGNVLGVAVNDDGSVFAFSTNRAINTDDTNNLHDVYVVDTKAGTTTRVSVGPNGESGDGNSGGTEFQVGLSGDGRYVLFDSEASNLVTGDTNEEIDVFIHDRQSGTTERVSLSSSGTQASNGGGGGMISSDGTKVLFYSNSQLSDEDQDSSSDIYVRDRSAGTTTLASPGSLVNDHAAISANGLYVVFKSESKLVDSDTNGDSDIYRYDLTKREMVLVSANADQIPGNSNSNFSALSADGRYVVFSSYASNLVENDTNGTSDVFVKDMTTGELEIVSLSSNGEQGDGASGVSFPSISADGRYVVFDSMATNLADGTTPSDIQVYLRDRTLNKTFLLSMRVGGEPPTGLAYLTPNSLSGDTKTVVFLSQSNNIDPKDTNQFRDAYAARFGGGTVTPKTKLSAPVVSVNGKNATLRLTSYDNAEQNKKLYKIRYQATLLNTKTKRKVTKISKKSDVIFKKLSKGKYSATYRVQAVSGSTVKFETKSSKAVKFSVGGK